MHVHILGICGTFMAGIAILARQHNYKVTGSDKNVYPPMSTQLSEQGIEIFQGYDDLKQLEPKPDVVIVGNVISRGLPVIEAVLNRNLPIYSGPEWLAKYILTTRHVLAVSGTHGKTTTTSMLAWILEYAGKNPGFLIGGIPNNFGISARLGQGIQNGQSAYFVIEADEYDSAFFDKRSKFIHYRPRTLIINNIEFDHADIFADINAIRLSFHHLVRTVPGEGLIVYPDWDDNVNQVLKKGCWSKQIAFDLENSLENSLENGLENRNFSKNKSISVNKTVSENKIIQDIKNNPLWEKIKENWSLLGQHNLQNALAAILAANHIGIAPTLALEALMQFKGVKRRMELRGEQNQIKVYDDFAHHPTAIQTTLAGLRAKLGEKARILAVVDIRSNTMRAGHHKDQLAGSVQDANQVYFYRSPDITWDVQKSWQDSKKPGGVYMEIEPLVETLLKHAQPKDHVVFMSNGGFGGIHSLFLQQLQSTPERLR